MIATTHTAAWARKSGPIQRTSWTSEAYCWTCTAASPASAMAPSAYAIAASASARPTDSDRCGSASVATAIARARPRDHVPGARQREPPASEHVESLAVRVAGLAVARVQVERVSVVGDLPLAVGTLSRSDLRYREVGAHHGVAGVPQRWPGRRAGAGALTCRSDVLLEQVQRAAMRVDEDLAEVALACQADRRRVPARGRRRRGCAAAAAAGADRQRGEEGCCRGGESADMCVGVSHVLDRKDGQGMLNSKERSAVAATDRPQGSSMRAAALRLRQHEQRSVELPRRRTPENALQCPTRSHVVHEFAESERGLAAADSSRGWRGLDADELAGPVV